MESTRLLVGEINSRRIQAALGRLSPTASVVVCHLGSSDGDLGTCKVSKDTKNSIQCYIDL